MLAPCARVQQENLVTFQVSLAAPMADVRERIADALRRRLYPNSGVHLKQLAHAVGRSGEAVRQWAAGEASIKAEDLYEVARFLDDPALIAEVFGELGLSVEADGVPQRGQRCVWFTHKGTHEAPAGHADFARRFLGLPLTVSGDASVYAMRNCGWAAVELRQDRRAVLAYDDRGILPGPAAGARDWLLARAPIIEAVRRRVLVGQRWIEAGEKDAELSAAAVWRAAEIARSPHRVPWRVERLALDAVPEFMPLLRAYNEAPARIVEAAAAMGELPKCSLLRVSGGAVESLSIGSAVDLPRGELVGGNILARADSAYAAVLHQHMTDATDGPSIHWLRGSILGTPRSYIRAAFYAGPETGLVLTRSIVRPSSEALAA